MEREKSWISSQRHSPYFIKELFFPPLIPFSRKPFSLPHTLVVIAVISLFLSRLLA